MELNTLYAAVYKHCPSFFACFPVASWCSQALNASAPVTTNTGNWRQTNLVDALKAHECMYGSAPSFLLLSVCKQAKLPVYPKVNLTLRTARFEV